MNKKIIIIVAALLVCATMLALVFLNIKFSNEKQKVVSFNNEFVEKWGTYSYKDFDNYPNTVKKYLTNELFSEYFDDEQPLYLRRAKMTSKEYSLSTKTIKNLSYTQSGDKYFISTEIEEKIFSTEENSKKTKKIQTTIIKQGDDYKVIEVKY